MLLKVDFNWQPLIQKLLIVATVLQEMKLKTMMLSVSSGLPHKSSELLWGTDVHRVGRERWVKPCWWFWFRI